VSTLGRLAAALGEPLRGGDPEAVVSGVASLDRADATQLAFVSDRRYLAALANTSAGCVILKPEWADQSPVPVICAADPYLSYARASRFFERDTRAVPGVHTTAVIDASVVLPERVRIGAHVCIEADVVLGDDVVVGPGCVIGSGARLGAGTRLMANVTIYHDTLLGERCRVHSGTVIGADGFGFARGSGGWERISQLGRVRIGNDVDIGASVTIDRGAVDDTVIEDGVIIDDQVHIGHNCHIGRRTAIAGCTGIAGSTRIGSDCTLAGQVGVSGHLEICDNVHVTGQARVTHSISESGSYASGTLLETKRSWGRNAIRFTQLDALHRRVAELEARLAAAEPGAAVRGEDGQ
jgi:UDP-3-O-[3-hydroxymyristoyl] glucosamine N-acyltransferase